MRKYFGTDGIRGEANKELTVELSLIHIYGKQINISVPLISSDGGTQEVMHAGERKCQFKHVAWSSRKIR